MICRAIQIVKSLLEGNVTEEMILETEILVRDGCTELNLCRTTLDHFLIRRDQERKDKNDPTILEEDRKGSKERRK